MRALAVLSLGLMSAYTCCAAQSSDAGGMLTGVVLDPSGARVAHAHIQIVGRNGEKLDDVTDGLGHFVMPVPAGTFDVVVEARGFERTEQDNVSLTPNSRMDLTFRLVIPTETVQVDVPPEGQSSTAAGDNKSALMLDKEKLATLSNDQSIFEQQLLAMAGGDGQSAPQIFVDGFSGGRFPPKNTIQQVRINQNPFSAEYESYGLGRIEIFTKPGTDKFHGQLNMSGSDEPFNARNPYTGVEPPYFFYDLDGHLTGPLGKKTSFFAAAAYFNQQNNAVVNAVDPAAPMTTLSQAVSDPMRTYIYTGRLDRQMSANNTLTARYEYSLNQLVNAGVGLLSLPTEGYNSSSTSETLQVGDSYIVSMKTVAETRFQYIRTRLWESPMSGAPTVIVQGSFNGGGASLGTVRDALDQYEFQEYLSFSRGNHFIRAGGRYRLTRDADSSTGNYNGQFTFPTLDSYEIEQQGLAQGLTPAQIRANGGGASQFTVTAGQPSATILTGDLGLYAEDEWKVSKSLTLDYGTRFETQSAIPDHADWAPRAGFAWAVGQRDKKGALAVVRGGFGLFHSRFPAANLLTAVRQNGISQQTYFVTDPDFYPHAPSAAELAAGTSVQPTTYHVSPHLKTPYDGDVSLSVESSFGRFGNASVTYLGARGLHQYVSRNINAPLPGTFNPADPASGVRPLGGTANEYEYDSNGIAKGELLLVSANMRPTKRTSLWSFYVLQNQKNNTSGAGTFPSNQYDVSADYGRSRLIPKQRLYLGGNIELPHGFGLNEFLVTNSGTPYDITTGTDLNGDSIFNDRPSFATDLSRASVVKTSLGNFDTDPIAGQKIIPVNYGLSPAFVSLNMQLGKDFSFGPRETTPGGAGKPATKGDAPYSLGFAIQTSNVFNHNNPGTPIGVLSSPLFGRSISLASTFSNSSGANRTVLLEMHFSF